MSVLMCQTEIGANLRALSTIDEEGYTCEDYKKMFNDNRVL